MIKLSVLYNRLVSTSEMLPYIESVTLTERLSGKASELSIIMNNADGRFTGSWACVAGDGLSVKLGDVHSETYAIDKVSVSASPRTVTWHATARPRNTSRSASNGATIGSKPPSEGAYIDARKSWDDGPLRDKTAKDLCARACKECGMELQWAAKSNPIVSYCARYNETGWGFISRVCSRFGLSVHSTATRITVTGAAPSPVSTESEPVAKQSLAKDHILSLGTASDMAPSKIESARLDPRTGEIISASAGSGDGNVVSFDFDADNAEELYDAVTQSGMVADISVIPSERYVAGAVLDVEGYGVREITEMIYTRTGDTETMRLKTRAAK